jgi:hypothetical protein
MSKRISIYQSAAGFPLSDLVFWFDANDGLQKSGTTVTGWNDKSGNGWHLTPKAPNQYPASFKANWLNGKPSLYRPGYWNSALINTSYNLDSAASDYSIYYVCSSPFAYAGCGVYGFGSTSYRRSVFNQPYPPDTIIVSEGGNIKSVAFDVKVPATYAIIYRTAEATLQIYANGNLLAQWSSINYAAITDGIVIGFIDLLDNYGFIGDIGEVIYYHQAHNETKRQQVENYLRSKYAHY